MSLSRSQTDPVFEPSGGEGFLYTQFHTFYSEVLRLRSQVERSGWSADGDDSWRGSGDTDFDDESGFDEPTDEGRPTPTIAPNAVWQVLVSLLQNQAAEARRLGGVLAGDVYAQAQYLMAALADEIFLNLEWAGRERWRNNLIESKLFESHNAGDIVFERLDELLVRKDAVDIDLARLYLATLALGFQGRYRDADGGLGDLFAYRKRLLALISQREAMVVSNKERFFPQSYTGVLDQGRETFLPYMRPWLLLFIALLLAWFLVSIPLWHDLSHDMAPHLDAIFEGVSTG